MPKTNSEIPLPQPVLPLEASEKLPGRFTRLKQLVWRNTVAALIATGCDGASYEWAVRWGLWDPGLATALGAVTGAAVNYGLNRVWTFGSRQKKLAEMLRYAGVSALGGAMSSLAVHMWAAHAPQTHPTLIWVVVKILVSWGYSLPLQRYYVFGGRNAPASTL